jgi:hypothetical protein
LRRDAVALHVCGVRVPVCSLAHPGVDEAHSRPRVRPPRPGAARPRGALLPVRVPSAPGPELTLFESGQVLTERVLDSGVSLALELGPQGL